MDTASIVNYIKTRYPKVVFKPVKFAYKSAIAFVVTNDKLVIGYINASGVLCKLVEPIDLGDLSKNSLGETLSKLPTIEGFTDKDKERLVRLFDNSSMTVTKQEHEAAVKSLRDQLEQEKSQYKVMYDSQSQSAVTVQKDSTEKLAKIQQEYEEIRKQHEDCKATLVKEKELALTNIEKFKSDMEQFVRSKDIKLEELQAIHTKMNEERNVLQKRLDDLLNAEEARLQSLKQGQDMVSEYTEKLSSKESEVQQLKSTVDIINGQLETLKTTLGEAQLKQESLTGFNTRCKDKLINEREIIIKKINEYNEKWNSWVQNVQGNVGQYKKQMATELDKVQRQLQSVLDEKEVDKKEYLQLKQSTTAIEAELKRVISEQLMQLNAKDEENKQLQNKTDSSSTQQLVDKQQTIESLQKELDQVKSLLAQNANTKIEVQVDYDSCYNILQNFFALNNIFFRKQEIVKRLNSIISGNTGLTYNVNDFTRYHMLPEQTKDNIRQQFGKLQEQIMAHIKFLDLPKYINSPNFQYMKSKATRSKVPKEFCDELANLIEYWNQHKGVYREQDVQLTNIYEDLSGAVRVYIRVKPLIGSEQKTKVVSITEVANRKQRSVQLDCVYRIPSISKVFGEFFGVFDDTFTTVDVYTGLANTPANINTNGTLIVNTDEIVEESETASPGLYNVFKQVESGYNIVLFGYGLSGTGKTFTLIGGRGIPGLLHYGLANLKDVDKIKVKYVFEQYVSAVDLNFAKVRGKIHNLVREVPQMREYANNENAEFAKEIPQNIDLDNVKVDDLFIITQAIESFRTKQGRIKATPNNKESSRSHLYMVFEVMFKSGIRGYVTIVDTAGRESPIDIFTTFIDSNKTSLSSIMSPSPIGGEDAVTKYMRKDMMDTYTGKHVFEVLKEGFYINETINHLIYFFNTKNSKKTQIILQPTDAAKYTVLKYFNSPMKEEKAINPVNNCLTIPIMKFLDSLSTGKQTEFKPTKFVMVCNVRQEEVYCDQTLATLSFAQTISST